ncbi:uncharacterized protein LOC124326603 [Daphnia pulicaria]|uniref:uncharacterized protein LOC124326603 n=1 Tax=Daphnia pulicaria TaxID=35523 RepID=UPI001EE9CCD8|nr:uncharacterized protein LOC124326603 [Daphnia pulicaria]
MQLVAVIPLLRARKIPTDILEPMLDFVHDRRGTSTNILLHPYLQDFKTYVHPASLLQCFLSASLLHNFSCLTGELDHFSCCDTPVQSLTTGLWPGNAEETSRRWIFSSLTIVTSLCRMLPLLLVRTKLGGIATDTETRHHRGSSYCWYYCVSVS